MYRKVDPDTPTADLLALRSSKPFLIELAQEVFDMKGSKVLHAFRQFDPHTLARIIDAKRDGVWNYGEHIVQIQGGYRYPRAEDALAMLDEAMGIIPKQEESVEVIQEPEEEATVEADSNSTEQVEESLDLPEVSQESPTDTGEGMDKREQRKIELEGMNKRPLQQLHLAVTGNRSKRGEAAEHLIERILNIEFSDAEVNEAPESTEFDPRPTGPEVIVNTFSVKEEEEKYQAEQKDNGVSDENVVQLSDHVEVEEEDAPEMPIASGLEIDFDIEDMIDRARAGIRGVFVLADIILRRQELIAQKLFGDSPPHEWPDVPMDGIIEDFEYLTGEETASDGDSVHSALEQQEAVQLAEAAISHHDDEPPSRVADADQTKAVATPDAAPTANILSETQIRNLAESDLYDYAESIGIENARAVAFTPFLVRDVLKKIKSMSVQ